MTPTQTALRHDENRALARFAGHSKIPELSHVDPEHIDSILQPKRGQQWARRNRPKAVFRDGEYFAWRHNSMNSRSIFRRNELMATFRMTNRQTS